MFERYDGPARRILFFARYAASQHGNTSIEPEHLVLALLREANTLMLDFARTGETGESIRQRALARLPQGTGIKLPTDVEIPFSLSTRAVLEQAFVEADDLGQATIRPGHLLAALLATSVKPFDALRESGIELHTVREYLRSCPE